MEEFLFQTRLGGLMRALAAMNHNPAVWCEIPTWRKIRIAGAAARLSLLEQ
jgi:hypothetical protein